MQIELHQLDHKYERLKVRNRKEEKRIVGTMAQQGQVSPVIVVGTLDGPGKYVVIDGFKRVRAAQKVGLDTVEAVVWQHSEAEALVLMHTLQRPRERSSLEDAYLIRALVEEHGLSQMEVSRKLGRTKSWVSRRLGLVKELPEWLQEHIRKGEVQCYCATRHLVPLARTNKEHAKTLAAQLAGMEVTTRDVAELYYAWKNGTEEERLMVVSRPDLVLAARRARDRDRGEGVDAVLQDLAMVESLLRRADRAAAQLGGTELEPWIVDSLRLRKRRVWEAMSLLDNRLMEVLDESTGPGNETSHSAVA